MESLNIYRGTADKLGGSSRDVRNRIGQDVAGGAFGQLTPKA